MTLEKSTWNTALENVLGSKPASNTQAFLPALELALLVVATALDPAKLLESIVFVVVQIYIQGVPDMTGNLSPGTLPLLRPCAAVDPTHRVSSAGKEIATAAAGACSATGIPIQASSRGALCGRLGHGVAK